MRADEAPMSTRMTDRRVDITQPMRTILLSAFRVNSYRLVAPELPQWPVMVDIHATIPAGGTVRQVPEMLQRLLTERFGLVAHREPRPMDAYELTIGAGGTKMREVKPVNDLKKEFPPDPAAKGTRIDRTEETPHGSVRTITYPTGNKIVTITTRTMYERSGSPSGAIINATRMTMAELVMLLEESFLQPVVDNTGLKGVYQFTFELPQPHLDGSVCGFCPGAGTTRRRGPISFRSAHRQCVRQIRRSPWTEA
jgi:uncharacterized protein (TIGR03435 family)